jgi:glycolate oxidase FAD binding subunit
MLAAGDSGPLRHRFGTIRDLIIGVRIATMTGDLVQAGGRVVKNVAGYDLGKLLSGSQGSLAAIVSATFKLSPVLPASTTLVARFREPAVMAAAVARMKESQLEAISFDVRAAYSAAEPSALHQVFLRFATTARAVDAAVARAQELMVGAEFETLTAEAERALWADQGMGVWSKPGTIVRLSWASGSLMALLGALRNLRQKNVDVDLTGRAAVGAGLLRIAGSEDAVLGTIEMLRQGRPPTGAVTVLRASASLKQRVDPWDDLGSSRPTLEAIKRAFDPGGTLNAGRGPV